MINFSTITQAVETLLTNDPTLKNKQFTIMRGGYVNTDPDRVPWIGIYRGPLAYTPRTASGSNRWQSEASVLIIVQSRHIESGADAEELLEEYISDVLNVLENNRKLNSTVDNIVGYNIEYSYQETKSETIYFQQAEIEIKVEART